MRASARALVLPLLSSTVGLCLADGKPQRQQLLPNFPPLILPGCPQFPALNGPGMLCEDFDSERNGLPGFQFTRLPVGVDPNDPLRALGDPSDDVLGYTQGGAAAPLGTGGRVCSDGRGLGRRGCDGPESEENDWHLHSPFEGPGAGYDPPDRPGIGAPDGGKAHGGFRSMHWGRHVMPGHPPGWPYVNPDATRYRQIAAFVLDQELDLGPASTLEFWHMISVFDDENMGNGFLPAGAAFGGGQVQISLLGTDGKFSRWERLAPSFNGYDSQVNVDISVCQFDPGDDALSPADDTMCTYSPMWADLGDILGTDATCATDTDGNDPQHKDCGAISSCAGGPGCTESGSIGSGVWARSAFDLSPFAGRQARLRWIGSMGGGWSFGFSRSALEPEPGGFYPYLEEDDGWWIDDLVLTDLRQAPLSCAVDDDQDGWSLCEDCDDADAAIHSQPGETSNLLFAADARTITWSPPSNPGGVPVSYDLLRSTRRYDFFRDPIASECNVGPYARAQDAAVPSPGQAFFYLVRTRNGCPNGRASLGTTSSGVPRDGRSCP